MFAAASSVVCARATLLADCHSADNTTPHTNRKTTNTQQAKAKVNVGFWGGITPSNAHKHDVLWSMLKAGALGFKSFVSPSGINDFENVSRSDVASAMHFLQSKGSPYFVHAELVTDVEQTEVRVCVCEEAGGEAEGVETEASVVWRPRSWWQWWAVGDCTRQTGPHAYVLGSGSPPPLTHSTTCYAFLLKLPIQLWTLNSQTHSHTHPQHTTGQP